MKIDEFDQYIHDQYKGHEVTPPAAIEAAVMGTLSRMKWSRRLGGAAMLVLVGSGAIWGWNSQTKPSAYQPLNGAVALPSSVVVSPLPSTEETLVSETAAREQVEEVVTSSPTTTRLDEVEPIAPRADVAPIASSDEAAPRELQEAASGSDTWVISAEVEVKN